MCNPEFLMKCQRHAHAKRDVHGTPYLDRTGDKAPPVCALALLAASSPCNAAPSRTRPRGGL